MQLILMMLIGSLGVGLIWEKLDRKALAVLAVLILLAIIGFFFFKRFL